jgi:predicted amidohydrolase
MDEIAVKWPAVSTRHLFYRTLAYMWPSAFLLFTFFALAHAAQPGGANLIPNPDFRADGAGKPAEWSSWAPRPALAAEADAVKVSNRRALRLKARGYHSFGKWTTRVPAIEAGKTYRFEALYRTEAVENDTMSVGAILTWCKDPACHDAVQRDYADRVAEAGEWRKLHRDILAPPGAVALDVELALRLTDHGAVLWSGPSLTEVERAPHRTVRVVTTRVRKYASNADGNRDLIRAIIDKAAAEKPDLVLLTETFLERGHDRPVTEGAEPVPGPTTNILSEKARKLHSWIAMSLLERAGDDVFNTAVLVDREGRIAGKYRKVHLPLEEAERGVTPGRDYAVIETDFGKVGMLVCWDHWFSESVRALRLKGAELILLPVAGDEARHWDVISRARAMDNGVYIASSIGVGDLASRIVAPTGDVLAETTDGIASAQIDLDKETRVMWLSVGPSEGEPKSLYIKERRPDTYGALGLR